MLNTEDCLRKAKRNKLFVSRNLIKIIDKFPDWVAIVAFYSALHFIDAHLLKHHGIQRKRHEEREKAVAIHLAEIYRAYKRLFEMGFRARYLRVEDNPTSSEAMDVMTHDLPEIENYVMERMT